MSRRNALPRTLAILPGQRWTGHLTVKSRQGDGLYVVQFDARAPQPSGEPFIYDVVLLTGPQILGWTGTNPDEWFAQEKIAKG